MGSPWVNGDFKFDLTDNVFFKKDANNFIYALGKQQLNTLGNTFLLDVFLSKGNSVEFHYHSNASELVYCVTGRAEAAFINPNNNEWQTFHLEPRQVVNIPQGFFHYLHALTDDTHLLTIYDTDNLQTVFESDILRVTPNELMADVYCLDEEALANTLAPIDETVIIGPPQDCMKDESALEEVSEAKQPGMKGSPAVEGVSEDSETAERMMDIQRNNTHMNQTAKEFPNQGAGASNQMTKQFPNTMGEVANQMAKQFPNTMGETTNQMTKEGPIMYGGTVMREMNLCADCLRHYEY